MPDAFPTLKLTTLTDKDREAARAARNGGVVFRLDETRLLQVGGDDAARYLEAMCTRDLSGLDDPGVRYSALLDDRSHVVADFWIWRVADGWGLEVEKAMAPALVERLNRFAVADDVDVEVLEELTLLHLEGPRAPEAMGALLEGGLPAEMAGFVGHPLIAAWARRSRFGEEGFTLACRDEPLVWSEVKRGMKFDSALPPAQESLRLEAGRARCGIDFGEKDLLAEVGLWGAVSLDKGCFPGQEIVRRVISRGDVKRRLVGFVEETGVPAGASELHATSMAESVALGTRIGLGWVASADAKPGTPVQVKGLFGARVAALPFVSGPHAAAPDVPGERVENTASR